MKGNGRHLYSESAPPSSCFIYLGLSPLSLHPVALSLFPIYPSHSCLPCSARITISLHLSESEHIPLFISAHHVTQCKSEPPPPPPVNSLTSRGIRPDLIEPLGKPVFHFRNRHHSVSKSAEYLPNTVPVYRRGSGGLAWRVHPSPAGNLEVAFTQHWPIND